MQKKELFPVTGLGCAACAARVNKVLNSCDGVEEANVNYASATALVTYDTDKCTPEALRKAVEDAGYGLITDVEDEEEAAEAERLRQYRALRRQTAGALAGAVPVFVLSMFFMDLRWGQWVTAVLSTVVVFVFGRRFFINTVRQLRHGAVNMDTLVASSTGVAWLFSSFNLLFPEFWLSRGIEPHLYFEAASVIIAFILIGRLLEARARQKTTGAIRALMGLQAKTVTVLAEDGSEKEVPIQWARPGDTIIVRPGERVAVDGTVLSGESYVDAGCPGQQGPCPEHGGQGRICLRTRNNQYRGAGVRGMVDICPRGRFHSRPAGLDHRAHHRLSLRSGPCNAYCYHRGSG